MCHLAETAVYDEVLDNEAVVTGKTKLEDKPYSTKEENNDATPTSTVSGYRGQYKYRYSGVTYRVEHILIHIETIVDERTVQRGR